jgi:hypothetical protein
MFFSSHLDNSHLDGHVATVVAFTTALVSHLAEGTGLIQNIAALVSITAGASSILYHALKIRRIRATAKDDE